MSSDERVERLQSAIGTHRDFPKPGILFRDIFAALRQPQLIRSSNELLFEAVQSSCDPAVMISAVIGIDSRGFLFGPILADRLDCAFVPVRKAGKLPGCCEQVSYDLEYGSATLEIQREALPAGSNVVVVDDLLATGGTMTAAVRLCQKLGAKVVAAVVLMELDALKGRDKISGCPVVSVLHF